MAVFWQSIQDHLYSLLVNAAEHTFFVERAVIGLLRLTIRLLRRDEIAAQVRSTCTCVHFGRFLTFMLLRICTTGLPTSSRVTNVSDDMCASCAVDPGMVWYSRV